MLPSRGLRWSRQTIATTRRLEPLSARHCSTLGRTNAPLRANPVLSRTAATGRIPAVNPLSRRVPLIGGIQGVRHASTTPVSAAASSPAASTPETMAATDLKPSSLEGLDISDLTSSSLHDLPVQIGYLKALGLDYGTGPTAAMEWLLEHVHVYAGTPWWASIALAAFSIRLVLFKAFINAADNAARMQAVKPLTEPLTKKMMAARGDQIQVLQIRSEIQAINKRAGVKVWKSLVPMLQIFTGYGTFVLLRAMADLPVPGLDEGGILWFHDLTVRDPLFLLPAGSALALHWVLRKGGETASTAASPGAMKLMQVVFPAITLLVTSFMPAALQLSFFVSGILSLIQSALFRRPYFRSFFKMYQLGAPVTPRAGPSSTLNVRAPSTLNMRTPPTQAQLNSTYQPASKPDAGSGGAVSQFVKGAVQGASRDIRTTFSEAVKSGREMAGQGKEGLAQRQAKADKAAADAYEMKRQKEVEEERRRRALERTARKKAGKR